MKKISLEELEYEVEKHEVFCALRESGKYVGRTDDQGRNFILLVCADEVEMLKEAHKLMWPKQEYCWQQETMTLEDWRQLTKSIPLGFTVFHVRQYLKDVKSGKLNVPLVRCRLARTD